MAPELQAAIRARNSPLRASLASCSAREASGSSVRLARGSQKALGIRARLACEHFRFSLDYARMFANRSRTCGITVVCKRGTHGGTQTLYKTSCFYGRGGAMPLLVVVVAAAYYYALVLCDRDVTNCYQHRASGGHWYSRYRVVMHNAVFVWQ